MHAIPCDQARSAHPQPLASAPADLRPLVQRWRNYERNLQPLIEALRAALPGSEEDANERKTPIELC